MRFTVIPILLLFLPPIIGRAVGGTVAELDGLIEPYVFVNVGSPTRGILELVSVDRGDLVENGQLLARLESAVEEASVELARARAEMTAPIELRQARLQFVQRDQTRKKDLYDKDVISFYDTDQAETEKVAAQCDLDEAEERRRLAGLELEQAETILERRTIRSPIDGVVVERYLSPGEYIEDQPVLKLAQMDPLNVEVIAPVTLLGFIKVGARAEVRPEAPINGVYVGRVTIVDRVIDAASGTFGVRVELKNPKYEIPAGLKCRVRFFGR
jgi:RND family efflux transporter MFP subunit